LRITSERLLWSAVNRPRDAFATNCDRVAAKRLAAAGGEDGPPGPLPRSLNQVRSTPATCKVSGVKRSLQLLPETQPVWRPSPAGRDRVSRNWPASNFPAKSARP